MRGISCKARRPGKGKKRYFRIKLEFGSKSCTCNCNALNECLLESMFNTHTLHMKRNKLEIRRKREKTLNEVSPLDVFLAVYRCCDPLLRQLLVKKMYLCKLAVPFLYNRGNSLSPIIDNWPLRSLTLYEQTAESVLTMKTNVVTFCRIGRPNISKSRCLNEMLSGQIVVNRVFFDTECCGGYRTRYFSEGITEVFWLPRHPKIIRDDTSITFLNIRGSLGHYKNNIFLHLIKSISDCMIVFVESDFFSQHMTECFKFLQLFNSIVLVLSGDTDNISDEAYNELEKYMVCCTYEENTYKNKRDFVAELRAGINSLLPKEKVPLETRLQNLTDVVTTENDPEIKIAQSIAAQIFKQMKNDVPVDGETCNKWKYIVTPCSHIFSRKIGKLRSDLAKQNQISNSEELRNMLLQLRTSQCMGISKSLSFFVNCLIKCKVSRVYVMQCLQNHIDAGVKSLLPLLTKQGQLVKKASRCGDKSMFR